MPHLMFGQATSPAPKASVSSAPMRASTAARPTMNYPTYMGGFVPGPKLARRAVRPASVNPYTTSVSMYPTTGGISGVSAVAPMAQVRRAKAAPAPSPYGNSLSPYAVASATDQRIACPVTPAFAQSVRSPFFKAEPITVTMPTQPSFYQPGVPSQPIAEYVRIDVPRIVAREAAPYTQGANVLAPYEGARVY